MNNWDDQLQISYVLHAMYHFNLKKCQHATMLKHLMHSQHFTIWQMTTAQTLVHILSVCEDICMCIYISMHQRMSKQW